MAKRKNLTPAAMTAQRFFRNKLAVVGLLTLGVMFLFSFVGGAWTPYTQDQVFYRDELQWKEYAALAENREFRFFAAPEQELGAVLQAQLRLYLGRQASFSYDGNTYRIVTEGEHLYTIYLDDTLLGLATLDILTPEALDFSVALAALRAYSNRLTAFSASGTDYTMSGNEIIQDGESVGHISRWIFSTKVPGSIAEGFRDQAEQTAEQGGGTFTLDGRQFRTVYEPSAGLWRIREESLTRVWDSYAPPSRAHPLGTDKNGMDMLTRLMYGGRVSLVIGFVVVLIAALLGVVLGGISGYFGGWSDQWIMRLVDIFYCIPSTPLLIILGAAMDGMRLDPQLRMLLLMLILGFLGWPSIARLVRGQILSLREQEFMTAAEAAGLRTHRRIFRHLLPNVIPQLIVTCTMSLGSTILTEASLSFLGLGVKFPFASWGNIMNDVSNSHVLTSYWFVWIPAGICLMLTVLGFNFVGDGLRDAFDPRMKR